MGAGEHPPQSDFGIVIDPGAAVDLQCEAIFIEPLPLCRRDHPAGASGMGELAGS